MCTHIGGYVRLSERSHSYCRTACSAARGGGVPPESRALSNTTRGRRPSKTRTGRQNHWDGRHGRYEEQGPKDSDRASPELRVGESTSTPAPTPRTGCAASSPCRSGTQPGTGGFHSGRTHRRMTAARRKADALPPNPDLSSAWAGASSPPSWRLWPAGEASTLCRTAPYSPTPAGSLPPSAPVRKGS